MSAELQVDPAAKDFVARERPMLIGGDWVDAASGKTFEVFNPATGEVLANVAEGDSEDIDRAVKTARAAFDDGPRHIPREPLCRACLAAAACGEGGCSAIVKDGREKTQADRAVAA